MSGHSKMEKPNKGQENGSRCPKKALPIQRSFQGEIHLGLPPAGRGREIRIQTPKSCAWFQQGRAELNMPLRITQMADKSPAHRRNSPG